MKKTSIVCLTPIKNEEWILDSFIKATSVWADKIIILDQNSSDRSIEIAMKYEKVLLIRNKSKKFDEEHRQNRLIQEARKVKGKKIFIALDADEILTPNFIDDKQWLSIKDLEIGTVIKFNWMNICPDKKRYWTPELNFPFGFVDNGVKHIARNIHSNRLPYSDVYPSVLMKNVKIMHFQYIDWKRMLSKHRWYQCYELIKNNKHPIEIYRQYHHMFSISDNNYLPFDERNISLWKKLKVNIKIVHVKKFWWDIEVNKYIKAYGSSYFKKLDIWTNELISINGDPRSNFDKMLIKYLESSQSKSSLFVIQVLDKVLKVII